MRTILASALLALASSAAVAQPGPVASASSPHSANASVPVTLGQSVVTLTGPWKFHVGDSPQWANPNFDDSNWETVDLTPTPQTTLRAVPIPGFVSGWTTRGHAGYAGYAWYRIRVCISGADGPLALLAPRFFDSAFQLFVNGHLAGSFGKFNGSTPELYFENPAMFSLPPSEYQPGPDGTTLLAFRFYMQPVLLRQMGTGGMHGPPIIGLPAAATALFSVEWEMEYRRLASALTASLIYFLFALLIAMMFAFNRTEKILLWPLSACIVSMIYAALIFSTNARWLGFVRLQALINCAVTISWYLWMLTWWAYFGLQRRRWLFNSIVGLSIVDLIQTEIFFFALHAGTASHRLLVAAEVRDYLFGATSFLATAVIAFLGWKSAERGRRPLYLALLFFALPNFTPLLQVLHLRTNWQPFGVQLSLTLLSVFGWLFFFSIVLFQQFRASLERQQATEEDLKQAQEVQHLLIPRNAPDLPGWLIESEYRPARHVGGDFFHIQHDSDGSLLVVVGDVSGKGLKAAMTVSAIVGALRGCAVRAPAEVLAYLNRVLHGQISGFATCAVASIAADGALIIANAGHLSPYRNGKEMALANDLPLGVTADTRYEETHFKLAPGDRLTFISDGVVEAANTRRELFGFERAAQIINRSASAIAEAAQQWGQEDDITVLTVSRTAKLAAVTA